MSETKETATKERPDITGTPATANSIHQPDAPMLDMVLTQTIAMAMHNAISAQQQAQVLNAAIVSATCNRILSRKDTGDIQQAAVTVNNSHTAADTTIQPATTDRKKTATGTSEKK